MAIKVYKLTERVYHIHESIDVFCTLITGSKKALLIDTGYGFGNIKSTVDRLCKLPLIIINSHGHLDHVQGNSAFREVLIHPLDMALRKKHTTIPFRIASLLMAKKSNINNEKINYISHFKPDFCRYVAINDGEEIDLGDIKLDILWTPGHTQGSICILDKYDRMLFSGDSFSSLVWLFLKESTNVKTYINSLKKVLSRLADFDEVISSHSAARFSSSFLKKLQHCAENISLEKSTVYDSKIAGRAMLYTEGLDRLKEKYNLNSFEDFMSIVKSISPEELASLELCAIAYKKDKL